MRSTKADTLPVKQDIMMSAGRPSPATGPTRNRDGLKEWNVDSRKGPFARPRPASGTTVPGTARRLEIVAGPTLRSSISARRMRSIVHRHDRGFVRRAGGVGVPLRDGRRGPTDWLRAERPTRRRTALFPFSRRRWPIAKIAASPSLASSPTNGSCYQHSPSATLAGTLLGRP